jgi:hypothetical protein
MIILSGVHSKWDTVLDSIVGRMEVVEATKLDAKCIKAVSSTTCINFKAYLLVYLENVHLLFYCIMEIFILRCVLLKYLESADVNELHVQTATRSTWDNANNSIICFDYQPFPSSDSKP